MVQLWALLTAAWLALAMAAGVDDTAAASQQVPGGFIVECEDVKAVARAVEARGGRVRLEFNSALFRGLSLELPAGNASAGLEQMAGVKEVWPLRAMKLPAGRGPAEEAERTGRHMRRQAPRRPERPLSSWTHALTGIDKLHAEGISGQGITIAVVDSGVNYTHPALGGCSKPGSGCRVAKGANFCPDGAKDDPMDHIGHGTAVASVAAGYDADSGFVGAAPNATIYAYRIGCDANVNLFKKPGIFEDTAIKGWMQAQEDGAHIIISSTDTRNNFPTNALSTVVSRIAAGGILCISAGGNDAGFFKIRSPATSRGGMAVASVSVPVRPGQAATEQAVYTINGKAGGDFEFVAHTPGMLDGWERQLHDIDADYGDVNDGCNGRVEGSLEGRMALIHAHDTECARSRALEAFRRGARHMLVVNGRSKANDTGIVAEVIFDYIKAVFSKGHHVQVLHVQQPATDALTAALSGNRQVTVRKTAGVDIADGLVSTFSSAGPTLDLDIKPDIAAPGDTVPIALRGGGYDYESGSSYASPLVAGAAALVAEARGIFANEGPLLRRVLTTTARPLKDGQNSTAPSSVALQGGGLVSAWHAAHATTHVSPASLAFNDSDHRPPALSLTIMNTAKFPIEYRLRTVPALTAYALPGDGSPDQHSATVRLSREAITLGPGQSAPIEVSASDPEGLDPARLPVWSGWIDIKGDDGTALTVPYLGLAASLRAATVLGNDSRILDVKQNGTITLNQECAQHDCPAALLRLHPILGSAEIRIDVSPLEICPSDDVAAAKACTPRGLVTQSGNIPSIGQINNYPRRFQGLGFDPERWYGRLASGEFVPPGRYKLVARALALFGDADNESDWQVIESNSFAIVYADKPPKPSAAHTTAAAEPTGTGLSTSVPWASERQHQALCRDFGGDDTACIRGYEQCRQQLAKNAFSSWSDAVRCVNRLPKL